jgi:hypothetical protein
VDAACRAAALPASRLVAFVRRRFAASQRAQQQQVSSTPHPHCSGIGKSRRCL